MVSVIIFGLEKGWDEFLAGFQPKKRSSLWKHQNKFLGIVLSAELTIFVNFDYPIQIKLHI